MWPGIDGGGIAAERGWSTTMARSGEGAAGGNLTLGVDVAVAAIYAAARLAFDQAGLSHST